MKRNRMNEHWRITGSSIWVILLLFGLLQVNFMLCSPLNDEGVALLKFKERVVNDPFGALSSWNEGIGEAVHCSWFGIECSDGYVVSLNLKNLCLEGTLSPELHDLLHIKSIILRNNSFSGFIPEEIKDLNKLEFLDLGYNSFSGPVPPDLGYNIPILLLDNNRLSCHFSPELEELMMLSEVQVDENLLTGAAEVLPCNRHNGRTKDAIRRRLLADTDSGAPSSDHPTLPTGPESPQPAPSGRHNSPAPQPLPPAPPSTSINYFPPPLSDPAPTPTLPAESNHTTKLIPIVIAAIGGFIGLVLIIMVIYLCRRNKITTVGPWATGLSGQLQKAFVTGNDRSDGLYSDKPSYVEGIPNLRRSELETACEDLSNVVGQSSIGTIYKGTLSSGVEIAAILIPVASAKDWSRNLEKQFRKKIETLSKVNHKNFINLIGYCEEVEPFTRMLVFEYAPNGSLFEHLHAPAVREAEHLDWGMRLRVAMGIAYCLEHMHQLVPPITHPNLNSSAVNLSEDYAAKVSDFCSWNEVAAAQAQPIGLESLSASSARVESNVYSFGLVLLEIMTGRVPLSVGSTSLEDWVSDYLIVGQPLQDLVDPMLRHFNLEQLEKISEVIRKCLRPDPQQRPGMRDVAARLKEITGLNHDKATPRLSPLWWAELEIRSANGG